MKENLPASYPDDYFSLMIRNVLDDYFKNLKQERDFDYPLMSLLAGMGFHDIHFTHGDREIGKDFIAKRREDDVEYQYSVQSKKGDINQAKCASEVIPQLTLASVSGLSHPQFDTSLPRKVILVYTGQLVGNASLILQNFNTELQTFYKKEPVAHWGPNQLAEHFEKYGLSSIHQLTSKGLKGFAEFYLIYGNAIDGKLSDTEIEAFSQTWLDKDLDYRKRILRAGIEAEILAIKLVGNGLIYEAIITYLALARTVMQALYEVDEEYVAEVYKQILQENIIPLCKAFQREVNAQWETSEKQVLNLVGPQTATVPMLHYLVWCSRILEIHALLFHLTDDEKEREAIASCLTTLIETEQGCGHPPSDRYATTLVWTTLALVRSNRPDIATQLIKKATIWLCDRIEKGFGIANYDADEFEQTAILVGYSFSSVRVHKDPSSFLATVLAALAAYLNDNELYALLINDFAACEVAHEYWQVPDSEALFTIYSKDSRTYPNSVHEGELTDGFAYAQHLADEPEHFRIVDKIGTSSLILLSVLLKDRFFPKTWDQF